MPLRQIQPFENWYADQPVRLGKRGKLSYAFNDAVLFGHAELDQKRIAEDLRETYKDHSATIKLGALFVVEGLALSATTCRPTRLSSVFAMQGRRLFPRTKKILIVQRL